MARGVISTLKVEKQYGFIRPHEGGKDQFFHATELCDDLEFDERLRLREVEYDIGTNNKDGRERAINVRGVR